MNYEFQKTNVVFLVSGSTEGTHPALNLNGQMQDDGEERNRVHRSSE